MTTGRINQITILKEATNSKKNRNLFFYHLFPLARRYPLSLETAEIPEKLLFQVSLLPEILSVQKSFYTIDQRTPSPYHSTLWVSSNQVPPNRYPGVSQKGYV
ncbi:ALH_1b_G0036820.mRNA.1.CDS.1 [Saccharomyces cerevisiae]|nr:ALH_1b_G0036820.mRNA.1.CDS.1 [Saccharomyces cerevisiae]CAI6804540.1 ALH_1b_G0036820.mRNA.1.CDS.1 [Saccharomyces cerevisiae]